MLRQFNFPYDPAGVLLPRLYIDDVTGIIYSDGIPQITTQSFPLTPINLGGGGSGGGPVTLLFTVPSSPTPMFNFNPQGNGIRQANTMTSDISPVFAGSTAGDEVTVIFTQDGTGSRAISWPGNVDSQTPQANSDPNSSTVFQWVYNGAAYVLMSATGT